MGVGHAMWITLRGKDMTRQEEELYYECIAKVEKLAEERGEQYNSDLRPSLDEYWIFGPTSIFTMVWVKIKRILKVIHNSENFPEDSILDAINYLIFLHIWYRQGEIKFGKPMGVEDEENTGG